MKRKFISIVLASLFVVGALSIVLLQGTASAQAISPPSLDGYAEAACGHCTSITVSLTTVSAPDVVVVFQTDSICGINLPTDTAGLTYVLRTYATYCPNAASEESYTIAQSPLTGDTITCSAPASNWIYCLAFATSGANTASPFDLSQPVVTSTGTGYENGANCPRSTNSIYPCIVSMTTSSANDFVFTMGQDTAYGYPAMTAGQGFTLINSINEPIDGYVQYEVASSPLSNAVLPFGSGTGHGFLVLGDAIQGTLSTTSSSSSSSSSTSSSSNSSSSSSMSLVTSTCTVTWTYSNGNPVAWSGIC